MRNLFLISALALMVVSCGQKPAQNPQTEKTTSVAPAPVAIAEKDGVKIFNPRVRVAPNGMDMTAAYLSVKNDSDKEVQIISAEVGVGKTTELHTHVKGADGQLTMTQVKSFPIPAKSEFALAPGGAHLMVFGVKSGAKAGDKTKIEIKFDNGKELEFDAPLVDDPTSVSNSAMTDHSH